jgi:hypothetical protein
MGAVRDLLERPVTFDYGYAPERGLRHCAVEQLRERGSLALCGFERL